MEAAAQPSGFIATLDQLSRLKDLLLQQHEGEVALLRGECSRLQKESSELRVELEKANAKFIDAPSPQHGNGSLASSLAGRLARRVLSDPIPPSVACKGKGPQPAVHQAPEVPDMHQVGSCRSAPAETEAHATQVFARVATSPRSSSPAVSISLPAGSVKDDHEETPTRRNSVEAKPSKDSYPRSPSSRRRSLSPRSEAQESGARRSRKGTAKSGPGFNRHDSLGGGNKSAEGRGRAALTTQTGRGGSVEDFSGVVPADQLLREASPRRKRGMHRAATMGSLPSQVTERRGSTGGQNVDSSRRGSTGGQSVDSMEFLGAGSLGLRSCGSRGSSIVCKDDGDRFNLREIWRENSNLLHTSIKNWNMTPRAETMQSRAATFREKMSFTFHATGSLRPAYSLSLPRAKPLTALHPASRLRLMWESVSLMLVIYDIAVVPMRCFDWPPESTADATDWISRVFWTTDILASFMTGVYINFELETRFSVVAKHYAKTWMAFDIVIVLSEWIPLIIPPSSDASGATRNIFDIVRLLRFARILRLLKLEMAFENFGTIISSKTAWKLNGVVRIFLYFVAGAHMAACGWYWVGTDTTNGWVVRENMGNLPVDYQYLTSMHWTLTQLHGASDLGPGNATEALYAIIALLLGVCSLCVLLSTATSEMVQLEETRSSASKQHLLMLSYLRKNHVGRGLSLAVKKCFDLHMRTRLKENKDIEVKEAVAFLPLNLQMDLAEEIRRPVVLHCGFFFDINDENPRIIRQLCHDCCSEQAVRPTESVFAAGDACACMYFVVNGEFQYTRWGRGQPRSRSEGNALELEEDDKSSEDTDTEKDSQQGDRPHEEWSLDRGNWVSEAVLWTTWEHRGELKAGLFATLLRLDAMKFARMLSQHHANACAYAVRYGRMFVKQLNDCPESAWSDVLENIKITKIDVFEEEQLQALEDDADRLDGSKALSGMSQQLDRRLSKCRTMNLDQHTQHYIFISHHKAAAGTEATLMQEALERMIDQDPEEPGNQMHAPVFLDSEDLSDLNDLKAHVRNTMILLLLLTEEVLKRPWCLIEIVTAFKCNIHILPVEIQKRDNKSPFVYPDEEFYKKLREGSLLSKAENDLIQEEGIAMEDLEKAIRNVFKKIAVPFSPHKSGLVREAELKDILRRCMDTIHRSESSMGNNMAELPGMPPSAGLPMVGVSSMTSARSGVPVNVQDSSNSYQSYNSFNEASRQPAMTPMVTDSSDGSCSGEQTQLPMRQPSGQEDTIDEDGPDVDGKSAISVS